MDTKRTILWITLALSTTLLWDNWSRYHGNDSFFSPTSFITGAAAPKVLSAQPQPVPHINPSSNQSTPAQNSAQVQTQGNRIIITTDVLKAEINSIGGELQRLELLKHKDPADHNKNVVLFDSTPQRTYLGQTGLIGGDFPNHTSTFAVESKIHDLGDRDSVQLIMTAKQNNIALTKIYTFKRGTYLIDLEHRVTNQGNLAIAPSLYLQLVRDGNKPAGESMFYSTFTGPAVFTESEHFQKINFEEIEKNQAEHATQTNDGWIALIQHYFVSAFLPQDHASRTLFTKKVDNNLYAVGTILPIGAIAPGATISNHSRLYSGPQESQLLEHIAPGLELVKDYGVLTIIAKPIFWVMAHIYELLHNWGWTIIVFTALIKLVFFPLSAASYRSMAKMKQVAPKITSIRERLKSDPQKMNQAMMELYRAEKINPLGGCLPILIQIPVFIALYWVLLASVEMRNAPWLGWIQDLAAPDPFYILPVLMAVSMFIQTKLNPTPPDPMQAKLMLFMPLIFSVMFFFFPSGLVLYWVVNNVLSIAQQWFITKKMEASAP